MNAFTYPEQSVTNAATSSTVIDSSGKPGESIDSQQVTGIYESSSFIDSALMARQIINLASTIIVMQGLVETCGSVIQIVLHW
ncbi:MAG: hypothetical protein CL946_02540 [Ectothiorhodospiraceae bacterium]|nr:hypothetical protein [Ectothiorhodospiraceae bacterium]